MAAAGAHGAAPSVDYRVELAYPGVVGAAWQLVAQMAALRMLILELTDSGTMPSVVLQQSCDSKTHIAVKAKGADGEDRVICSGPDVASVQADFADKVGRQTTVTFAIEEDRPGLLAEVTQLLKMHGANILHADVYTEGRGAVHVYKVQAAATGGRLSPEAVGRLEADLDALRSAGPTVRQVLRTSPEGEVRAAGTERLAVDAGAKDYLVSLHCPKGAGNVWAAVAQLASLRACIRDVARSDELPPVVLTEVAGGGSMVIEILDAPKDRSNGSKVLCSGNSVDDVQAKFRTCLQTYSTISFETDSDRPGLLAEVTELLRLHGANIKRAEVRTDSEARRATHVYEVQEATTGQCLSDATISQLEADFRVLRDAAPSVRQVLAKAE